MATNFKGIDVSYYHPTINWAKAKADGVQFAILRAGYRGYGSGKLVTDTSLNSHMKDATNVGIPIGVYFFSQAINAAEGKAEANYVLGLIKGHSIQYPIYIDTEYSNSTHTGRADGISRSARTMAVKAFCETIQSAGYYAGIYASTSWLNDKLDMSQLKNYDVWVAHYNAPKPSYAGAYGMWQYSENGSVAGISGRVDMNICYKDYPTIIANAGLNGLKKINNKVLEWQQAAVKDGFSFPKAGTDGVWGSECVEVSKKAVVKYQAPEYKNKNLTKIVQVTIGVTVDGYCGVKTRAAIISFQKSKGLVPDGSVGPATWLKILGIK